MANADRIAKQIAQGLKQAAAATGRGRELAGVLIRRGTAGDPNAYPPQPAGPDARFPCTCLFGQFNRTEAAAGLVNGTNVKVMVAAYRLPVAPMPSDRLEIDGATYDIFGIDPLQPGGPALLYTVYARNSGHG